MRQQEKGQLRVIDAPFVVPGPSGVAVRDRLKCLTSGDEEVLRLMGGHLGRLASRDLKARCGKKCGNETIRVTPGGEVSIKLPAPLAHLANAQHGRYELASRVAFRHRGTEWRDRIGADRAVAYRIHLDVARGRWYLTASWTRPVVRTVRLEATRAHGMIGVDTNADHFAAYQLDVQGNPVGEPQRFFYDLSGTADHRDAQVRHASTRLLHWAKRAGVAAIGIENLDFATEKTREKHGRKKRFRQLISGMPTGKLRDFSDFYYTTFHFLVLAVLRYLDS